MLYINGEWVESESNRSFPVYNPANGEVIGEVADGNRKDTKEAINAAAQSFKTWSKLTAYERSSYLYKAYQIMMERKEELARLMTIEQGKPLKAARNEVQYGADFLLWYAEEAKRVYGEIIPAPRRDQRFLAIRQPVGVVGAITPWNYPVSMITRKLAPALAAGCTVVLKPAEETPLCAKEVFKVFADAGIPNGVINLVSSTNPEEIGEELLSNKSVKKITFTGSTNIGKLLAEKAARYVKRISMELGGHAPFIVYDDADPVHAAKGVSLVKFLNTGQACISPNRIFVHRSIAEEFTNTLIERVHKLRAGNGLEEGVSIGPLVNEAAIEKVDNQVKDAIERGASLKIGGNRMIESGLDKGNYYAPTILSGINKEMKIFSEETFGPVAPIIIFDSDEEVMQMANDTNYGLAAYVYTNNLSRAMRAFEELNFGIIGINDINPTSAAAPFGGMNESGLGREGGREGIEEYLETKLGGFSI
ncbi:NAD-dependent succinate-semialdehyde dehydrogenase [Cytobacillus dafuensis]|uniref:NAD-dependent succinate-semialdehyde dehydrogenase n=1 Tax=Cytobacillus dafuensis TaxID=1742359 RepID=A0A5B8ZBE2_CYTDA|nr:NAD-dependent succinate-semialdehyde dehydrogenase [Cytobacillus dafuensis]QED48979.1 NAD-dependent succinate-semialdehyde dehydrogenase [Cytobacillus dafuensis]